MTPSPEWIILTIIVLSHYGVGCQQQAPVAPNNIAKRFKIVIPDLYPSHYQFWLKNHPRALQEFEQICSQVPHPLDLSNLKYFQTLHSNLTFEDHLYLSDLNHGKVLLDKICSKIKVISKSCWGYENNCQLIHLMPECLSSKKERDPDPKITWFSQADFGYILDRRREMNRFCFPDKYSNDTIKSSLECTKFFRTCRGDNLFLNFKNIPKGQSMILNSNQDLMKPSRVGGWNCDLQLKRIQEENGQKGVLQSWFNELENYNLMGDEKCDVTIENQAFFVKLDATSNMYHYFTNFLNLYATLHLNNKFSIDNQIIIWDNHLPRSKFEKMWTVFSKNPPKSIAEFEGKRVCFKKFIFSLLPRMIDGLYYNTPLTPDCYKTGLFDAFNKHTLHRLGVRQLYNSTLFNEDKIRITLLERSTHHRRILNLDEMKTAIAAASPKYQVQVVDFANLDFLSQLRLAQETDILMGIHGAGLTHALFLPDWAALFELYDCGDKAYSDLARLRGVRHFTISDPKKFLTKLPPEDGEELKRLEESRLRDHEKFSNYKFDIAEVLSVLDKAVKEVLKNRSKHVEQRKSEPEVAETKQTSHNEEL